MNQKEFYKPLSGLLDPALLLEKRAAIIGLGSGGSRVAAELGRLGISLALIEKPGERLEEHNIVRHLLGCHSLGKSKLSEVARYVRNLNPFCRVSAWALDVVAQNQLLRRRLQSWRPDVIAVCTDNEASKHAINELALQAGIPQTGGAVYDGGVGGEIYRVRPGEACYGCIATKLRLDRQAPRPSGPPNYNGANPAPQSATICALNLDIEQIALLQCRMTLESLLDSSLGFPPEANLCVFANRVAPGFARPLHCEFYHIPRKAECLDCGQTPGNMDGEAERILTALGGSLT